MGGNVAFSDPATMTPVKSKTYRKIGTIQAVQWDGSNLEGLQGWGAPVYPLAGNDLKIVTTEDGPNGEAKHVVSLGDWIATQGNDSKDWWAIKPDKFFYEEVK